MRFAVIGAGNMGGAIVRALATKLQDRFSIIVSNPSQGKLDNIKKDFPFVETTNDNLKAIEGADIVLFAIKPWLLESEIKNLEEHGNLPKIIISVAGGISLEKLKEMFRYQNDHAYFCVIPNTAISIGESMTFVSCQNADKQEMEIIRDIFESMGKVAFIDDNKMNQATALASCGIAYAFKYIQACVQAGVQLGFRPEEAQKYAVATVKGAMEILEAGNTTPQLEIDKVTTPGGMTIRGINQLEKTGFVPAVIDAILEPLKNK